MIITMYKNIKRFYWTLSTIIFYVFLRSFWQLKIFLFKNVIWLSHIEIIKVLFHNSKEMNSSSLRRILKWPEKVKICRSQVWWVCFMTQNILPILNKPLPDIHRGDRALSCGYTQIRRLVSSGYFSSIFTFKTVI